MSVWTQVEAVLVLALGARGMYALLCDAERWIGRRRGQHPGSGKRCGDLAAEITRIGWEGLGPARCVLDAGHAGSHTDGQGCEWMYNDPEVTP